MAEKTVVFVDLTGSTGVFELLGNVKATNAITRLTQWLGAVCVNHNGRVVKYLGDGVLMTFMQSGAAVDAVSAMERLHRQRLEKWPKELRMRLKVGMARGEVVEQQDDCFGDAVNVASRLSDLAGPEQLLATDTVIDNLPPAHVHRVRSLGPIEIRGRTEPCVVFRVEWQDELASEFLTMPGGLNNAPSAPRGTAAKGIDLSALGASASFNAQQLPIYLGRDNEAQFVVQDQRVSRLHAKIDLRQSLFVLEDVSSYGTWVRFSGTGTVIALRRQDCVLHDDGEIALGASFDDFSVPTISFHLVS
jgi:class 3 adenylate cyclase